MLVGKCPEVEGPHEVGLAEIPVLVVSREEIVVHRRNRFDGKITAVKTLIVVYPRGVGLFSGNLKQAVCR